MTYHKTQINQGALDLLVRQLSTLPGLGRRSAQRIALHLLTHKDSLMRPLAQNLTYAADTIQTCQSCGNLDEGDICHICRDPRRQRDLVCVVATVADLWAVERTASFRGVYHVLGGVLSAMEGVRPDDLNIDSLIANVQDNNVKEVILALGATVDGQSTMHYLVDKLKESNVIITKLAQGVPIGGELNYLDDGTIMTALKARASN